MRPSYSPSIHPLSVSKLHYVSYFEQIFNCGSSSLSSLSSYSCSDDQEQEQQQQQDFNNSSKSSSSSSSVQVSSYDADNETTYKDESAKEYLDRIRKLPINIQNSQESPTTTTASASTPTTANSKSVMNKNKPQQPHYEMFKVVIPEQQHKPNHRSLKHTDSDSTQSTQSMSDDDDMSFCDESREGIEEHVQQPLMSILRRKQKNGIVITRTTRHGVRFLASTKFPDPNEIQYRRKKVPRLTSKQRQELLLNNYFNNNNNNNSLSAVVSVSETILPHLSPTLLIVHTHNNNEFRDYSSTSNNNTTNNNMSHKDTELRRQRALLQKRLERRSQQQQYQYQDDVLQQQQLSMLSNTSEDNTSNGIYAFR